MNLNIANIPKAIVYFLIGVILNIVFYNIFSPTKFNMLNILANATSTSGFTMNTTTTGIIWLGIMAVSILVTLGYPAMLILDNEDD